MHLVKGAGGKRKRSNIVWLLHGNRDRKNLESAFGKGTY